MQVASKVSWARGLLYDLVEALGYVLPGAVCYEHVDDLSHQLASGSKNFLRQQAITVAELVQAGVEALDIRLSHKSVITSNGAV